MLKCTQRDNLTLPFVTGCMKTRGKGEEPLWQKTQCTDLMLHAIEDVFRTNTYWGQAHCWDLENHCPFGGQFRLGDLEKEERQIAEPQVSMADRTMAFDEAVKIYNVVVVGFAPSARLVGWKGSLAPSACLGEMGSKLATQRNEPWLRHFNAGLLKAGSRVVVVESGAQSRNLDGKTTEFCIPWEAEYKPEKEMFVVTTTGQVSNQDGKDQAEKAIRLDKKPDLLRRETRTGRF
jgi:hypothetical protein